MPKLARQYDDRYYSDFHVSQNTSRTSSYGYSRYERSDVRYDYYGNPINQQPVRRRKPKNKRKKGILQPLIVLGLLALVLFSALPFSFNNITKAMFVPTPYKEIQADMHDISFPTHNYLSNNWFLGQRGFSYSADEKHAQMTPLKENVKMPVLTQSLMNLMENKMENLKKEIEERDYKDSTREISPLRIAEDAIVLDTSFLTPEEVVEKIVNLAKEEDEKKKAGKGFMTVLCLRPLMRLLSQHIWFSQRRISASEVVL